MSSGTVFFAEYCTVPFFGNGEITVPQSASIVLFFWFFVKMRGKKITGRNEKILSCVPELWVLKYGPKNVYFCNITYCVEKVHIIFWPHFSLWLLKSMNFHTLLWKPLLLRVWKCFYVLEKKIMCQKYLIFVCFYL